MACLKASAKSVPRWLLAAHVTNLLLLSILCQERPAVEAALEGREVDRRNLNHHVPSAPPRRLVDSSTLLEWNQDTSSWLEHRRRIQINATRNETVTGRDECSICNGFPLLASVVPPHRVPDYPDNLTCQDWEIIASSYPNDYYEWAICSNLHVHFAVFCCDTPRPEDCEQIVRDNVLTDGYDAAVMPRDPGVNSLSVNLELEYFHVTDLDEKSGTTEIFVWIYLNWTDHRLAWDQNDTASVEQGLCASSFTARASLDVEKTEIWVPDFDLFNQVEGVQKMPEAMATVFRDGSVSWRRNGGLKALCFFSGLRAFPYDILGCQFLMGSWTNQDKIRFIFHNGGFASHQHVHDQSYTEYQLLADRTETGYFSTNENEVYYNFYFQRASRYYITQIVIPNIVFTMLSFGVFLLDIRVGERLTYGLAVLLVIIAQDISTSGLLPITERRLWIDVFLSASFYWVFVALLESLLVAWLYYLHDTGGASQEGKKAQENGKEKKDKSWWKGGAVDSESVGKIARRSTWHGNGTTSSLPRNFEHKDEEDTQQQAMGDLTPESTKPSELHIENREDQNKRSVKFEEHQPASGKHPTDDPEQQTEAEAKNASPSFQQRKPLVKQQTTFARILNTKEAKNKERHEFIKKLDRYCFYIVPSTYLLFVIVMFATKSLWNNEELPAP